MGIAIVIHGGAGVVARTTGDREHAAERSELARIRDEAWALLANGKSALDVVEAAVVALEECELFNAGKGAVLGAKGTVELDAAIMDGATREAGAVAVVDRIRNPIRAARRVLGSPHVILAAHGAHELARAEGLELVEPEWFVTERRREQWRARFEEGGGTVGAVATDAGGHVAAATSTGGMLGKAPGRIGDSPIVGAGTFAWDRTCAVSGTGDGEMFLRLCLAHRVSAGVEHGSSIRESVDQAIAELRAFGGEGGLIATDPSGAIAWAFHATGMYRAWRDARGDEGVAVE
jgi:L-asparaginase / beta-aspartyl-peptidase